MRRYYWIYRTSMKTQTKTLMPGNRILWTQTRVSTCTCTTTRLMNYSWFNVVKSSKSRQTSDIIRLGGGRRRERGENNFLFSRSLLVHIYGTQEFFVNEYRNLLSDRLLQSLDYDVAREVCNCLLFLSPLPSFPPYCAFYVFLFISYFSLSLPLYSCVILSF